MRIKDPFLIQNPKSKTQITSDASPLRRTATVVRDRRRVADRCHTDSGLADCSDGGFAAAARTFNPNFNLTHPCFGCLAGSFTGRLLGSEGRALSRTSKSAGAR